MSLTIRRILAVALAVTLGAWVAIAEPHRHMLAAFWSAFTDFWNYYIAF